MKTLQILGLALLAPVTLGGCLAGAIVAVAAETVEAGVEITGAVVGAAVDIVIPDGDKDDDDKGDDDRKKKKKKDD